TGSTKSLADINAALYTAAQAGVKWGESLDFMSAAEKLAVANNANLNTTVDLLTGTMNAYGFTLSDVGHLNDVFFTSTLIGKQTIDELGQSMGNVVGIAANFGVSFEDLSAAISTLTAKGMDTAEAITAVKGVITTIVSPSVEAAKAASELGLTFSASELKAKGLDTMLRSVMQATGGNADTMAKLFTEVRALNGVMQLTGDGMEFFKKALDQINNSAGSAEGAYQKMSATFENQTKMIVNTATVLMIDVGTRLEATGAEIAGSFGNLLKGIKIGVDEGAFDPLFTALSEAGGALSTWVSGVARALPEALKGLDFSKLVSALKDLGGAFGEWFGAMDLTKVEDLHDFIQGLIDGIAGLVRVTEGMVDGFRPFFTAISDFLISVADSDEETQKMTGTILALSSVVEKAGLGFVVAVKAIDEYGLSISGVFNVIAGGAQIMWNGLQLLANSIQALFVIVEGALLKFVDMLSFGLLGKYNETFRNLISSVEESGKNVSKSIMENGVDAGRGLDKMIEGFKSLGEQSGKTGKEVSQAGDEIGKIPEKKKTLWQFEGADEIKQSIVDIGKEFVTTGEKAEKSLPKDVERNVIVGYIEDENGRREITQKIKTAVPDEKKIDVKMNDAAIKEQAKTIATALEWKAKLDIAEIESKTKIITAIFKSLDNTITSTGTTLSSIISTYSTARSGSSAIYEEMRLESQRRDEALQLQKDLTYAEIENIKVRTAAMQRGDAMIQIDGAGLQPHLEAFMFEILAAIQVKANAEGQKFLVGI
ncbi:MAG: phage tail tape measure protein, partial [Smithellaceae bacterium]